MNGSTGSQRCKFFALALNDRIHDSPLSLLLIKDLDGTGDRIIISDTSNFVYESAIEGATSKWARFEIHGFYLLNFVADDIKSLTSIGDDLIVQNTWIMSQLPPRMYIYLLLKQIECDDLPYFKLLQYVKVFLVKSYLYIFWLFKLLLKFPPIKYRSPFGIAIDLWNSGTLNVMSKSIDEKLAYPLSKSKYCKIFSSFWKKCKYLWGLDYLNVFMPIILFFGLLALFEDLLDMVDLLSSSLSTLSLSRLYLYLSLYLSLYFDLSLYFYFYLCYLYLFYD